MRCHFKTSHVKVYLDGRILFNPPVRISIHPMLKFIAVDCSSALNQFVISKHPMLKLIFCRRNDQPQQEKISIHPMLKFIVTGYQRTSASQYNFNTSHVKVYRLLVQLVHLIMRYFNTSHVKVYPRTCNRC